MQNGYDVFPLFINYGQITAKSEQKASSLVSEYLGINPLKTIDVTACGGIVKTALCGSLKFSPGKNNNGSLEYFPHRNLLLVSIGAVYASSINSKYIGVGILTIGEPQYPDISVKFVHAVDHLLKISGSCRFIAPFSLMSKSKIVQYGLMSGFDYNLTFSCNTGGSRHCGRCYSCIARKSVLYGK